MDTGFQNLNFGERIRYLFSENGIDCNVRGWAVPVANDFFKRGIIQYKDTGSGRGVSLNQDKQRDSVKTQLTKHIFLSSVDQISTVWIQRYCLFFGCSAAYLFGQIPLPTIEQTDICKVTGLSPEAVKILVADHAETQKHKDTAADVDSFELNTESPEADAVTKAQLKEIFLASHKYTSGLADTMNFLLTKKHTAYGCLLDLLYSFFTTDETEVIHGLKDNTITVQHRRGFYITGGQLMSGVLYDRIRETLFEYRQEYQRQKKKPR